MALLRVENMTHFFGGLRAVYNYDLEIGPGDVRGLIGPNGAGKTTIFNLITGIYRPTEGRVFLEDKELNGRSPHEIAAMGIGRTFQNMLLWRHMTVLEHVKMARYSKIGYGLIGAFFGTPRRTREEQESEDKAYSLLRMLRVDQFADQMVLNLPYGAQRRVEMARALAARRTGLDLTGRPAVGLSQMEWISWRSTRSRLTVIFASAMARAAMKPPRRSRWTTSPSPS